MLGRLSGEEAEIGESLDFVVRVSTFLSLTSIFFELIGFYDLS
jgi:hypothetical protein